MSASALDALQACELLDSRGHVPDLERIEPVELIKRLDFYRSSQVALTPPEKDVAFSALISSQSASNTIESLLPHGFLYDRIIVNDPLVDFARPQHSSSEAYSKSMGLNPSAEFDCGELEKTLRFFERLSPLIRLGLVEVLPISETVTPWTSTEGIPFRYSPDAFRSMLPEHVHDFAHRMAEISELEPAPSGGGLIVHDRRPKAPTRGIAVRFKNDSDCVRFPFYVLSDSHVVEEHDDYIKTRQVVDWESPPSKASFDAWVYQSINQVVLNRLRDMTSELVLASHLKSTYLTESQFESELCGLAFDAESTNNCRTTAVNFLNANAPYLKISDPSTLAKLRSDNCALFERWQLTLLNAIGDLNGYGGDFEEKAKQIFACDIQPQMDEINKSLTKLAGGIGGATLVSGGVIGMALLSNTTLPVAAVLGLGLTAAAGRVLPAVTDYIASRRGPAFIWSKLSR